MRKRDDGLLCREEGPLHSDNLPQFSPFPEAVPN